MTTYEDTLSEIASLLDAGEITPEQAKMYGKRAQEKFGTASTASENWQSQTTPVGVAPATAPKPMGVPETESPGLLERLGAGWRGVKEAKATVDEATAAEFAPRSPDTSGSPLTVGVRNIPRLAGNIDRAMMGMITTPVLHPVETVKGLTKTGAGLLNYYGDQPLPTPEAEQFMADRGLSKRQSGMENLESAARTVFGNPLTPAMDTAMVGGAIKGASGVGKSAPAPVLKANMRTNFEKSVKPTTGKRGSFRLNEKAANQAHEAVMTITENKDTLQLTNDLGERVEGLPKNLRQFSQAVDQTKRKVFSEYDALAQQAGAGGAKVETTLIADELAKMLESRPLHDLAPQVVKYIEEKVANFDSNTYTPAEAQEAIRILNDGLDSFYKNPSPEFASRATVDALIVNKLRSMLDDTIQNTTGEQYQVLKNKYGALRSIEKEVANRTLVEARKNFKHDLDFVDVATAAEALAAMTKFATHAASGGVYHLARAGGLEAMKKWFQYRNNPSTAVKNLFKDAEKLNAPPPTGKRITLNAQGEPVGTVYMRGGGPTTNDLVRKETPK